MFILTKQIASFRKLGKLSISNFNLHSTINLFHRYPCIVTIPFVSGLDFAWSSNGYVYHTKYDNIDQIPLGALQRTGDNILALAQGMGNAPELSDVTKHKPGNMIYFDLLGLVLIRWPEEVGTVLNILTILLSSYLISVHAKELNSKGD